MIRDNRQHRPGDRRGARAPAEDAGGPPAGQPTGRRTQAGRRAADQLAERTADLQRLQAEYSNYRKRVERDRVAVKEQAVASVLTELLPVLDDIGRARDHGELDRRLQVGGRVAGGGVGKLGLEQLRHEGRARSTRRSTRR